MRKKRDNIRKERRTFAMGDLIDSNEQELEKAGFDREVPQKGASHGRPHTPMREENAPKTHHIPEKKEKKALPPRSEEKREIRPAEEERLPRRREAEAEPNAHTAPGVNRGEEPQRECHRPRRGWVAPTVIASVMLLSALLILWGAWSFSEDWIAEDPTTDTQEPSEEGQKIVFVRQDLGENGLLTASELYAACADTVVSVVTEREGKTSVGSGFVLREDGYVGTAFHVVEGSDRQTVMLADGSRHEATLVAGDAMSDLALLKIDRRGLPTVTVGSSKDILIGEKIYAIGTPASPDYAGSLSAGEISYVERIVHVCEEGTGALQKKMRLLQITAPVNPGNSGCPLFDEYGRLVGVVTMKLGNSYTGIGFAIPSDGAIPILLSMMEGKPIGDALLAPVVTSAPKLGILGEAANVGGVYGVRIVGFPEKSPAAEVLRKGDLLVRIDETAVCSAADIDAALREKFPADTVWVTVLRGAQSLTFGVTLGK